MNIRILIVEVLGEGPHEGNALYREVTARNGKSPPHSEWRLAIIELEKTGVIESSRIADDDGKTLEVIFKLANKTKPERGVHHAFAQNAA